MGDVLSIALAVFLFLPYLGFKLHRFIRMRQVMRYGEDLVLPVRLTSSYMEGRFAVGVYTHKMIFIEYQFFYLSLIS